MPTGGQFVSERLGHQGWGARLAAFALCGLLATGVVSTPAQAVGPQSVADLAEGLSGAVVNVSTTQKVEGREAVPMPDLPPNSPFREFFEEFFNKQQQGRDNNENDQEDRQASSLGSGFVIDPEGLIVTNNHVVSGAEKIQVNFVDGSNLDAEVVGRDTKTDLALLRVKPTSPLKAVELGDSDKLRVGDWVMAIGNPFGLGGSVTLGIVSARNRDINAGPYDDFIQTDAAINRGNSGGPLFDMNGKVIGINSAIISPSGGSIGIGFAIPSTTAMAVLSQLRQYGEVRRGWLGVRIQTVTDEIAESLGLSNSQGALVAEVTADGPAEKAGIAAGDVIVEFDGKPVAAMRDLPRIVANTPINKPVKVIVASNGQRKTLDVTVGDLDRGEKAVAAATPEEPKTTAPAAESVTSLGLQLRSLSDELREQYQIKEGVNGVVVTEVTPGSSAAEKRIEAGDVIVEVGQKAVSSPDEVVNRVKEIEKNGRKSVLMLVANSQGEPRFLALRLDDAAGDEKKP
ncbi:serine protease Do [Rhodoligotrophos appendicifer]|uniref:Do family serine endopeptidase n=1 Tax=Rhodoligotrophos appendicifer TaxID=987056 RepID=UPI0011847E5E|nr:Do family serine endopeptidase [Rhodoligotrophos appendicifer]